MRIVFAAAFCAGVLAFGSAASAENPVAREVQKLQASAQQLLSLRDFLGPLNRGVEMESSGSGVFVVRDAASMAYSGEFRIRTGSQGSIEVERVTGPAIFDDSRSVRVPSLRLDAKARAQVAAILVGSQLQAALSSPGPATNLIASASVSSPLQNPVSGLRLTTANIAGPISQYRAVFFRDGSGYVQGFRTEVPQAGSLSPALRVANTYYTAVRTDGAQVWREAIVEAEGDAQLSLTDLESHCSCPAGEDCRTAERWLLSTGLHIVKRSHQLVSSVPPQLLAQMSASGLLPAPGTAPAAAADPSSVRGGGSGGERSEALPPKIVPKAPAVDGSVRSL
jgi:hypothetical protein